MITTSTLLTDLAAEHGMSIESLVASGATNATVGMQIYTALDAIPENVIDPQLAGYDSCGEELDQVLRAYGDAATVGDLRDRLYEDERVREMMLDADAELLDADGIEAGRLFTAATGGADAPEVVLRDSWRLPDGETWTRTTGRYADGQTCDGWHIRDGAGEFVEFIEVRS